jgi:hypothetical protein
MLVHPPLVDDGLVGDSLTKYPMMVPVVVKVLMGTVSEVEVAGIENELMEGMNVFATVTVTEVEVAVLLKLSVAKA